MVQEILLYISAAFGGSIVVLHLVCLAGVLRNRIMDALRNAEFSAPRPFPVSVIVVAKDLYVALGAGILHYSGNLTVALPSFWGKFATLLQIVTVALVLLGTFVAMPAVLLEILFSLTALVTTIACVHYIWCGTRVFKES